MAEVFKQASNKIFFFLFLAVTQEHKFSLIALTGIFNHFNHNIGIGGLALRL